MGLASMTYRRIRKVLAWVLAISILTLVGLGGLWVVTEVL